MNRRRGLAMALAAVLAAGCGGTRNAAPSSDPRECVLFGTTARIKGFDPVRAGDVASIRAFARIYEGLLQYAYLDRPYRLEPLLAEAMPEVSADGLTYTFHLRQGIRFQDDPCFVETGGRGRELTADDFVYSIKRVADRANASPGYWAFRDRIEGLDEFRAASGGDAPADYGAEIAGLRATGRYTLQFRLKRPMPHFLWMLALHYAAAVPREAVAYYGADFVSHPVGTGPFRLAHWRRNYRIEYARNPQWGAGRREDHFPAPSGRDEGDPGYREAAGALLPRIDRIVEYVVGDPATRWQLFLRGQLALSAVSRDQRDAAVGITGALRDDLRRRGLRMLTGPTMDVYYIGFNMDDPVVGANRKLRQALTSAFDRQAWVQGYRNQVLPAEGPVPPAVEGYTPVAPRFPYDLDGARRLLEEAGYPGGIDPATGRRLQLTLEIADADNPEIRLSTDLFVQFMDKVGVVIRPGYNNRPAFFEKVSRRQAQMFRLSWVADYPDAENFLQLFFGPNASPGSNRSNYGNAAYDDLYRRLTILPPSPERNELVRRMVEILQEDCPWIFTHHPMQVTLLQPWLREYKYHDFPYGMEKYYRIEDQHGPENDIF